MRDWLARNGEMITAVIILIAAFLLIELVIALPLIAAKLISAKSC